MASLSSHSVSSPLSEVEEFERSLSSGPHSSGDQECTSSSIQDSLESLEIRLNSRSFRIEDALPELFALIPTSRREKAEKIVRLTHENQTLRDMVDRLNEENLRLKARHRDDVENFRSRLEKGVAYAVTKVDTNTAGLTKKLARANDNIVNLTNRVANQDLIIKKQSAVLDSLKKLGSEHPGAKAYENTIHRQEERIVGQSRTITRQSEVVKSLQEKIERLQASREKISKDYQELLTAPPSKLVANLLAKEKSAKKERAASSSKSTTKVRKVVDECTCGNNPIISQMCGHCRWKSDFG